MRREIGSLVSLALLALTPAFAHHSKANFLNETIVLQGEVVDFRWANPHAIFSMTVSDASGKATVWQVEVAATPQLVRSGWTENSLLPGDPWGVARGIPSGPGNRVVERYRLTDGGETLTVDFTIEDPEYLTAPFAGSELWRYAPNLKLVPNKCDVEVAHKYLGGD